MNPEKHAPTTTRTWLALLLAVAAVVLLEQAGFATSDESAQAQTHANRGLQLAQQGQLGSAEEELRLAAKLAPNDPGILASLGTVLAMEKKLDESTTVFRQTLKLAPHDVTARRYLAANLWQMQRFAESRQNLKILLQENPQDEPARLLLGMVSENMKDYATAARMLSSVPGQVRQQPESIAALARSYYHLGQKEDARNTLAELSARPERAQAVFLGAQVADQMQDYETAEKMLLSIRSNFPDQGILGYRLSVVQYHAQHFEDSQQTLLGIINTGKATGEMYNLLGWCYYKLNQPKEAVDALNHAITMAPKEEANYLDLTDILAASGSLPSALTLARKATTEFPNSAHIFEARGSIETKVQQYNDAIASYSRALQLDPSRPDATLGLALAQFSAGMTKEAIATLEAAGKHFPREVQVKVLYASVLLKESEAGDPDAEQRAERLLQSALALDASSPGAHYELGKLELRREHVTAAVRHLEKAVKLDPDSGEAHFALSRAYRRAGRAQDATRQMELYQMLKAAPAQAGATRKEPGI